MTLQQAYRGARQALRQAGIEEDAFEAKELVFLATGQSYLAQDPDRQLAAGEQETLRQLLERRCRRYPLQYLEGSWPFCGLELQIGEGVLIPRADTETVVARALQLAAQISAPRVLDLCAGSGAIGLAVLAARPDARVTLVEKSPAALQYCEKNAGDRAQVIGADVLGYEAGLRDGGWDCIVCNPPYIAESEYDALAPELRYEPRSALVAEGRGLAFYEYIIPHYWEKLAPGGALVFEIGAAQRGAVMALMEKQGYRPVGCDRDLAGLDRCVFGCRPG